MEISKSQIHASKPIEYLPKYSPKCLSRYLSIILLLILLPMLTSCGTKSVKLGGKIVVSNLDIDDWSKVKSAVLVDGAMPSDNLPNLTGIRDATKVIGRFVLDYDGSIDQKTKSIMLSIPSNLKNDPSIKLQMGASVGDEYNGMSLYVMNSTLAENGKDLVIGSWNRVFIIKDKVRVTDDGKDIVIVKALKRR